MIVAGIALIKTALRSFKLYRIIEDVPTSFVRSAAQGFVELHGFARSIPGHPLIAPLSGERCCWYQVRSSIEENDKTITKYSEKSKQPFILEDKTGWCLVWPDKADIHGLLMMHLKSWSNDFDPSKRPFDLKDAFVSHNAREKNQPGWVSGQWDHTENTINDGDEIYILGNFKTLTKQELENKAKEVFDGDFTADVGTLDEIDSPDQKLLKLPYVISATSPRLLTLQRKLLTKLANYVGYVFILIGIFITVF